MSRFSVLLIATGMALVILGTCGVLAGIGDLLAVGVGLIGIPAVLGAHMDAVGRTDAPGGYLSTVIALPSNEELAIQRYVTNPDAEVEDLERDLDHAMRPESGAGNLLP